jgi:hypothetical protein
MPRARTVTDDDVRGLRMASQHLHRPRLRSPADMVRHLLGVQAQVLSAAGLALQARTEGLTSEAVDRARQRDRSIVLTWAMRGTLHLIAAEDYGWLVPLVTEPSMAGALRRLKQEGVPPDQPARAARLIGRMLDREGPSTRAEIAEELRRHDVRTEGQAIAYLVWHASAQGVICHGPPRGREPTFVLVRDWLGKPERVNKEVALAELAVRYLRAHQPAQPEDLAFWSGVRLGEARRAWRAVAGRLLDVETDRGPRWRFRSRTAPVQLGLVRLLPSFDEYLLGWKDRQPAVDAGHWKKVNRGGGWLHPVIVVDGHVAGTWTASRTATGLRVAAGPFSRLPGPVRRGAVAEARRIGDFLGTAVDVRW